MDHYKYYIGITSQIAFCQVPLRLDSFNSCSFSCSYCFAKRRAGNRGNSGLQITQPKALDLRFDRIRNGELRSAVDEFLQRRIPLQFGGMTDPFSPFERRERTSLRLMKILAKQEYPTLISTKGLVCGEDEYIDALKTGNFLVRFSISVINPILRNQIERGIPTAAQIFSLAYRLAKAGVFVAFRLQPIVPEHEYIAFKLVTEAKNTGAKHVTFEYLKLPADNPASQICKLKTSDDRSLLQFYRENGATLQGREYVLPASYKRIFLSKIGNFARKQGLTVGFGDNEFLPFSDGKSCCNGADLYLKKFNLFETSPASLIRAKNKLVDIRFSDLARRWMPKHSIGTYLNSRTRIKKRHGIPELVSLLDRQWTSGKVYSPDFFYGVENSGRRDANGRSIYIRSIDKL